MEKSIEEIWKEGFIEGQDHLSVKINDLYERKSTSIVDKMRRMYDINIKAILGAILFIAIVMPWAGMPILAVAMVIMLGWIVIEARPYMKSLEGIQARDNCYQYLMDFQDWRTDVVARFSKVYAVFYPVLFLAGVTQAYASELGAKILSKIVSRNPDWTLVGDVPLYFLIGLAVLSVVVWLASGPLYRLDMNMVYGKEFKRLDDIIEDMETLRDAAGSES